jgi:hypothetical protein
MPQLDTASEVAIALFALGGVGWLIRRSLAHKDERQKRITGFLDQMRRREQETIAGLGRYHVAANNFARWKPEFIVGAKATARDYRGWRRRRFASLVKAIADLPAGDVDATELDEHGNLLGAQKLLALIQKLIAFME